MGFACSLGGRGGLITPQTADGPLGLGTACAAPEGLRAVRLCFPAPSRAGQLCPSDCGVGRPAPPQRPGGACGIGLQPGPSPRRRARTVAPPRRLPGLQTMGLGCGRLDSTLGVCGPGHTT